MDNKLNAESLERALKLFAGRLEVAGAPPVNRVVTWTIYSLSNHPKWK